MSEPMRDEIYEGFLKRQYEEGMALAAQSDLLKLIPLEEPPVRQYMAEFYCKGLARSPGGEVFEDNRFAVWIGFPWDYLRRAEPYEVIRWVGPANVFHPNISTKAMLICLGRITPGTTLLELLYRCFDVITYNKVTMREDDALNHEACVWARQHMERFPIDRRSLKRRALNFHMKAARES